MSKHNKTQLKGPWQQVQSAVWLIGLAIIAWQNWWWPGILVLVAVSALVQAAIQLAVPGAVVTEEASQPAGIAAQPVEAPVQVKAEHPLERLPNECPKCSAPIRGIEVRWTGPFSADCPYCGANLPLKPA